MIREDWQAPLTPVCTCTPGTDGQTDSDGCPLHDLIVCGVLVGEAL